MSHEYDYEDFEEDDEDVKENTREYDEKSECKGIDNDNDKDDTKDDENGNEKDNTKDCFKDTLNYDVKGNFKIFDDDDEFLKRNLEIIKDDSDEDYYDPLRGKKPKDDEFLKRNLEIIKHDSDEDYYDSLRSKKPKNDEFLKRNWEIIKHDSDEDYYDTLRKEKRINGFVKEFVEGEGEEKNIDHGINNRKSIKENTRNYSEDLNRVSQPPKLKVKMLPIVPPAKIEDEKNTIRKKTVSENPKKSNLKRIVFLDETMRSVKNLISESPNGMVDTSELRNQGYLKENYHVKDFINAIHSWEDDHEIPDEKRINIFPYASTKFYIGKEMYPGLRDFLKKSRHLVYTYDPAIYDYIFKTHHESALVRKEKMQILSLLQEVSRLDNIEDSIVPLDDRINIFIKELDPRTFISVGPDVFRSIRQLITQNQKIHYSDPDLLDLVRNIINVDYNPQEYKSRKNLRNRILRFFELVEIWDDLNNTPKNSRIILYKNSYFKLNTSCRKEESSNNFIQEIVEGSGKEKNVHHLADNKKNIEKEAGNCLKNHKRDSKSVKSKVKMPLKVTPVKIENSKNYSIEIGNSNKNIPSNSLSNSSSFKTFSNTSKFELENSENELKNGLAIKPKNEELGENYAEMNKRKFKMINHIPECRRGSHQEAVAALIFEYIFNPDLFEYKKQWYKSIYDSEKPTLWEKHFAKLKEEKVIDPEQKFYSLLQDRPSDDFKGLNDGLMHIDLYNPELNISIEVNGCHFPSYYPDQRRYVYQMENDRKKIKNCFEISEFLLGIPPLEALNYEDYFDFLFYGAQDNPEFNPCRVDFNIENKTHHLSGYIIPKFPNYVGLWGILIPENYQMLNDKTKKIVEKIACRKGEIKKNLKNPEFMNELLRMGKVLVDSYGFNYEEETVYSIIKNNPLIITKEIMKHLNKDYNFIKPSSPKDYLRHILDNINLKKPVEEQISYLIFDTYDHRFNFYYIPNTTIKINSFEFTLPRPNLIEPSLKAELEKFFYVQKSKMQNIRSKIIKSIEENHLGFVKLSKIEKNLNKSYNFVVASLEKIIDYENVSFSDIPIEERLNIFEKPMNLYNQSNALVKSSSVTYRYIYRGTDPFKKIRDFIENAENGYITVTTDNVDNLILGRNRKIGKNHDNEKISNILYFMKNFDKNSDLIPADKKLNSLSHRHINIYYLGNRQNIIEQKFIRRETAAKSPKRSNPEKIAFTNETMESIKNLISESQNGMIDVNELGKQGYFKKTDHPVRDYIKAIRSWEDDHKIQEDQRVKFFPYAPYKFYLGKEMYPELRDFLKNTPQIISPYNAKIYDYIFKTHHENALTLYEKRNLIRLLQEVSRLDNLENSIVPLNDRINVFVKDKDPRTIISIGPDAFSSIRHLINQKAKVPYNDPELLDLVKNIVNVEYDPQGQESRKHLRRRIVRFFELVEIWDDLNTTPKNSRIIKYKNEREDNKTYFKLYGNDKAS